MSFAACQESGLGSRPDNSQQKTHSGFFLGQKKRNEFYFTLRLLETW